MQTAAVEDELPSENFGVYRIRRQVFNPFSYVGGIVTSRLGMDGSYDAAYGLDGIFRLFGDDYLDLKWAQTFASDRENKPTSLEPARINVNWERRTLEGLAYDLSYSRAGSTYDPGIGFEMREDYTRIGNRVLYGWMPGAESTLYRSQVFLEGFSVWRNEDGEVESVEIGPGALLETQSRAYITIAPKLFRENVPETFSLSDDADVPEGEYTFYGLTGLFQSPQGSLLRLMSTFYVGSFYDGRRLSIALTPTWSVSSSLELSGTYELNRVTFSERGQEFTGQIARLRALVMLSTKFSISAFVQYASADDIIIGNFRIRYNPREGNDFYIVYDEGLNTDRSREIPALPHTSNRTLLLKYTYTFNF
jgi:hypothetical protein